VKKRLLLIGVLVGGLLVVAMGFRKRSIVVPLKSGGVARITPASTFGSLRTDASATIFCEPTGGQAGSVELWQDFFDRPIIVMASTNSNVLLCLYDFDVDLHLLRIDMAERFKPFPPGSVLTHIVCASAWSVESGATNDWQEVLGYLKSLPSGAFKRQSVPALSFGIWSLPARPELIVERMERHTRVVAEEKADDPAE
jgi:hypothetical protein